MTVARLGVYCGQMGMADRDIGSADGLGLADAIALLRDELLKARVAGAGSDIQLPVESMTVDLTVTGVVVISGRDFSISPGPQVREGAGVVAETSR